MKKKAAKPCRTERNRWIMRCLESLVALILLAACNNDGQMARISKSKDVEVSPGRWLSVSLEHDRSGSDSGVRVDDPHNLSPSEALEQLNRTHLEPSAADEWGETTELSLEWEGLNVWWKGSAIPITLREYKGTLFMIGLNRDEVHSQKLQLVFFRLAETGDRFIRIRPGEFPRQIATQNMWMSTDDRFVGTNEGLLDKWELVRKLDVSNRFFSVTLTARIWYQIEVDREDYVVGSTVPSDFVCEYAKRYEPVPLPTIVQN